MFQPACNCAFLCQTPFLVSPSPAVSPIPSILVATPISLSLARSLALSRSLSLPLDHHLPHHRKGSNVEPRDGVEDRYKLVLSQHCRCLFLASEKTATTTCRKVLAHRVARGLARADLSKRAARMARTACMWPCSAHAQMPL